MMTHSVSLLIPFSQIKIIKSLSDKKQMGPNKYSAESKIKKQKQKMHHTKLCQKQPVSQTILTKIKPEIA